MQRNRASYVTLLHHFAVTSSDSDLTLSGNPSKVASHNFWREGCEVSGQGFFFGGGRNIFGGSCLRSYAYHKITAVKMVLLGKEQILGVAENESPWVLNSHSINGKFILLNLVLLSQ